MALCNIANCYFKGGKDLQAREFYRKALQEFPNSIAAKEGLHMLKGIENREGINNPGDI
jgi:hypothetical protein